MFGAYVCNTTSKHINEEIVKSLPQYRKLGVKVCPFPNFPPMISFCELKGSYSGRASFTHMINIVPVKCGKTLIFMFLTPGVQNSISGSNFCTLLSTTHDLCILHPLTSHCTTRILFEYTPGLGELKETAGCTLLRPWVVLKRVQKLDPEIEF